MPPIQGPSTRGNAGIFGGSINPLSLYMQQNAGRQAQQAKAMEAEKKKRDDAIEDLRKWNPDKVWEDFYGAANNYVQRNVRDYTNKMFDAGIPTNQVQREATRAQGDANAFINKINGLKTAYTSVADQIDKDDYIADKGYYHRKINDVRDAWLGAANKHDLTGVNDNDIRYIPSADPTGWNINKIVADHMKALPEHINERETQYADQYKEGYNLQTTKSKLGILYDAKGQPILDPRTHEPAIHMTDDVFRTSMENPRLKVLVDHKVGVDASEAQQRMAMTGILTPYDAPEASVKHTNMTKIDRDGGGNTPTAIDERFKNNEAIVTGFRPDLLASTFDPYKPHQVEYISPDGKPVVSSESMKNGQTIYYDSDGKRVDKPTKIRVSFSKGGLAADLETFKITMNPNLSEKEKEDQLKDLAIQQGKLNNKDFDITTPQGRRAAHHVLSRILDEPMTPKERQGESYTKKVNSHYGEKPTGGVY